MLPRRTCLWTLTRTAYPNSARLPVSARSQIDAILDIEEIAEIPFVAMSTMPMPHQFLGNSIFDRLKQVQDIKTAVLRSTLDSFYQSVNRIKVVQEGCSQH